MNVIAAALADIINMSSMLNMQSLLYPVIHLYLLAGIDIAPVAVKFGVKLHYTFLKFEDIPPAPGIQRQEHFAYITEGIAILDCVDRLHQLLAPIIEASQQGDGYSTADDGSAYPVPTYTPFYHFSFLPHEFQSLFYMWLDKHPIADTGIG